MTKVKKLKPENQTVSNKVERVLGGDIETTTYAELSERFDLVKEEYSNKTYGISLSQESIALLITEILPNVEWVGQQAWDILEAQRVISDLKPNKVSYISRESVRAIFQFLATNKYKGVDHVLQVSVLLTTLAELIQKQIAKDEQTIRDAGFELQAAEMGITPEAAVSAAMQAENASYSK